MQKLDRLGWAAGVCFTAFGRSVGIRVNTPEVPADVLAALPPGWVPHPSAEVEFLLSLRFAGADRPGVREFHLLYCDHRLAGRTHDRALIVGLAEQEIQGYLAARARDRVFVHAGVVGWRGRAVLLPGRSMAGKSTLVAALLKAGATYYSDEFAVLDADGRVHPYGRRLSLRTPNGTDRPTAEALGAETGRDPLPVALVVRADYRTGADWRPNRLSPARALLELASYTLPEVAQTPAGQNVLTRLAATVPTYKGPRGEAAATAAAILRSLDARP